jgi:hypothetical protein
MWENLSMVTTEFAILEWVRKILTLKAKYKFLKKNSWLFLNSFNIVFSYLLMYVMSKTYQLTYLWLWMTYIAIYIYYMPCGNFLLCHMSQFWTIINNHNGWWIISKKKLCKNLHNVTCEILMNGWQLMMLAWHHGCSYNGFT